MSWSALGFTRHFILQTFSNYTEKTVEFAPINRVWYIGDADFRTQCTLTPDIEVNPNDWIGIYDVSIIFFLWLLEPGLLFKDLTWSLYLLAST